MAYVLMSWFSVAAIGCLIAAAMGVENAGLAGIGCVIIAVMVELRITIREGFEKLNKSIKEHYSEKR